MNKGKKNKHNAMKEKEKTLTKIINKTMCHQNIEIYVNAGPLLTKIPKAV